MSSLIYDIKSYPLVPENLNLISNNDLSLVIVASSNNSIAYKSFNSNPSQNVLRWTSATGLYNPTTGVYLGSSSLTISSDINFNNEIPYISTFEEPITVLGEFIKVEYPFPLYPIRPRTDFYPSSVFYSRPFIIFCGSVDNVNWTRIAQASASEITAASGTYLTSNLIYPYSYFTGMPGVENFPRFKYFCFLFPLFYPESSLTGYVIKDLSAVGIQLIQMVEYIALNSDFDNYKAYLDSEILRRSYISPPTPSPQNIIIYRSKSSNTGFRMKKVIRNLKHK